MTTTTKLKNGQKIRMDIASKKMAHKYMKKCFHMTNH